MRKITGERVRKYVNSDVELLGISWIDGPHLRLSLRLPVGGAALLDCLWPSDGRINIKLGKGSPLSWEVKYDRVGMTRWRITFEFAFEGNLTIECNDLVLHVDDRRLQDEASRVLDELCNRLDFCVPPEAIEHLVNDPPPHVAAFTRALFEAKGMDPADNRKLHQQVYAMVQDAFRSARVEGAHKSDEAEEK